MVYIIGTVMEESQNGGVCFRDCEVRPTSDT